MSQLHVDRFKRAVKREVRELKSGGQHVIYSHLLEKAAKQAGYSNYRAYLVYLFSLPHEKAVEVEEVEES